MTVHHMHIPRQRLQPVWSVDHKFRQDSYCDEEDAAVELWVRSVGRDIQVSTIELLIVTGMAIPPANGGSERQSDAWSNATEFLAFGALAVAANDHQDVPLQP